MEPMQIVDFSKPYVIDVDSSDSTIMQQSWWNKSAEKHYVMSKDLRTLCESSGRFFVPPGITQHLVDI